MIDHKFDEFARPFIRNQMIFYMITFIIPFMLMSFGNLEGFTLRFCGSTALFGAIGMFFFEIMDMYVYGARDYFGDFWNWTDCISLAVFFTYYSLRMYIDINPDIATENLWETCKLLSVLILLNIWLKISWFLKL
jgi:hypothetical protein